MADDRSTDGPPNTTQGVFLAAIEARRRDVIVAIETIPQHGIVAELVFDLFTHLALSPEAELDVAVFESFARRHGLSTDSAGLPGPNGVGSMAELICGERRHDGPVVDLVNALFTQGYVGKLKPLDVVERRNFTLRVVGMLPGVERLGPYNLTDFLDVVAAEEDALRFWQIYVDRVAAEIAKRGASQAPSATEPWLLTRLIELHRQGTTAPRGSWLALTKHVTRVMQAQRHRWRFIRHLAEGCNEPRMLNYLCSSPAMIEDREVIPVFLTRGNGRLVSCALLSLHLFPDSHAIVRRVLAQLAERPFQEIAARLMDIYAQLHLFTGLPAGSALQVLKAGVLNLTVDSFRSAPLDLLPNQVPTDSRALRHLLLLLDVEPVLRNSAPAHAQQYLGRVVGTWQLSFTPSGIEHPLNDQVWAEAVRRAIYGLVMLSPDVTLDRVESFGLGLGATAERWAQHDPATSDRLGARFLGHYAETVLPVARALYADESTRERGLTLYVGLIHVFCGHIAQAQGTGVFGTIEYVLPVLFPDLVAGSTATQREIEAAHLVAEVDRGLFLGLDETGSGASLSSDSLRSPAAQAELRARTETFGDDDAVPPTFAGFTGAALLHRAPTRGRPLQALAHVRRRRTRGLSTVLRAYSGLTVATELLDGLLRFVGVRTRARVVLTDRELLITEAKVQGDLDLEQRATSIPLSELTGIRVHTELRVFPLVFGGATLVLAALTGGHLVFVGLRTGDVQTTLAGFLALAVGLVVDATFVALSRRSRRSVVLEVIQKDVPTTLHLVLDVVSGAPVLDAFLAHDAARKELEQLKLWREFELEWPERKAAPSRTSHEGVSDDDPDGEADLVSAPEPPVGP